MWVAGTGFRDAERVLLTSVLIPYLLIKLIVSDFQYLLHHPSGSHYLFLAENGEAGGLLASDLIPRHCIEFFAKLRLGGEIYDLNA